MNTPGIANYSKETVGLRQPIQIKDQQFRLIYVYPMLFADILNQIELKKDLRNFLSISFLREIFVSNSLNIIQMASQIPSAMQRQNDVANLIGNVVLSSGGATPLNNNIIRQPQYFDTGASYQLQGRVDVKTNQVVKYLLSDPRTKKLQPQIEVVTLNNLIDVPVIVGTKDYSVPTYSLIYVLLIAIATNTTLDKYSNVEKIVRVLKTTREKDWVTLLSRFTQTKDDISRFAKWGERNPEIRGRLQLNRFTSWLSRTLGISSEDDRMPLETRNLRIDDSHDAPEERGLFNILKLVKNSLDDLALSFKFMLNADLLQQQIGLNLSNNTMQASVMNLSPSQYQIFTTMHDQFMSLVAVPGSVFLSSVFNTLFPVPHGHPATINRLDFLELKEKHFDAGLNTLFPVSHGHPATINRLNFLELKEKHFDAGLNKKIQTLIFDTFVSEIKNSISQYSPDEAQEKTKLLLSLCGDKGLGNVEKEITTNIALFFDRSNSRTIDTVNFNMDQLDRFTSSIHEFASQFLSQNKRFENVFSQIVKNGMPILKIAQTTIYSSIEEFIGDITRGQDYMSAMEYSLGVNHGEIQQTYIPQMTDTLFVIFYAFFLYRLQVALCEYVQILDVDLESKVNDVIDFPNYTMVITTDILKAVYTAQLASNLNQLINSDQTYHIGKMTQNNIKGMLKVLRNKLKIPSIIVYDERMNEYYYQFMFMSAPEKLSGVTLDSFVKNTNITRY